MRRVRPAAVAGLFYPEEPDELGGLVDDLLARARAGVPADAVAPKAILVPHAGYIYSGPMAAEGYARIDPGCRRVVLLGPVHRVPIRGLALPDAVAFETPLGRIPVGRAPELEGLAQVSAYAPAHSQEHSLEVQLPFLQRVLGDFELIPLAVGSASAQEVAEVLDALWGGPETVIVISSDLSHYHAYADAQARDRRTVDAITALAGPIDHRQACGATPVNGMLTAARARALAAELLGVCNSGDTAGDKRRVVGYCSVAFGALRDAA